MSRQRITPWFSCMIHDTGGIQRTRVLAPTEACPTLTQGTGGNSYHYKIRPFAEVGTACPICRGTGCPQLGQAALWIPRRL